MGAEEGEVEASHEMNEAATGANWEELARHLEMMDAVELEDNVAGVRRQAMLKRGLRCRQANERPGDLLDALERKVRRTFSLT